MRPTYLPEVRVPGATPVLDSNGFHKYGPKNDRSRIKVPLWNMPEPIRYVEHMKRRKNRRTGEVIEVPDMVPVYRGFSSEMVRLARSQYKRAALKEEGEMTDVRRDED